MGGLGGLLREYDWNGDVVWEHRHVGQHHDFRRLPNGNTIFLAWEVVPPEIVARIPGGIPGTQHADGCMYGDYIQEITPKGEVVWEWHACRDMEVEKYVLSREPEARRVRARQCDLAAAERRHLDQLPPPQHDRPDRPADPRNEVAAPRRHLGHAARLRAAAERQHHAVRQWLQHHHQSVLARRSNSTRSTDKTVWEYRGRPVYTFFSPHISGAQRLASGNTLICEGQWGRLFEVTPEGEIVWEYVSPFMGPDRSGDPSNEVFRAYRYAVEFTANPEPCRQNLRISREDGRRLCGAVPFRRPNTRRSAILLRHWSSRFATMPGTLKRPAACARGYRCQPRARPD